MTRDETIDFLHALWEQKGTQEITLDGRSVSVGTVCMNAIYELEKTADFVPVVRCGRCIHWAEDWCGIYDCIKPADGFCDLAILNEEGEYYAGRTDAGRTD